MFRVAVTRWKQERDRQQAFDAGFDHHTVKPVDLKALIKLLSVLEVDDEGAITRSTFAKG